MKLPPTAVADDRLCIELATHDELSLLLDVDGTLIPFAPTPEAATLDAAAVELLHALRAAGVRVVIVSGRERALVDPLRMSVDGMCWLAEHGSWRCDEAGVWQGPPAAPEVDELIAVLAPFARAPGARLERKSVSACLHWRLVDAADKDALAAAATLACDEWLESHLDFERLEGEQMLEVRGRTANKGRAVTWVRDRFPRTRIIAVGDDHTDEDMFAALRDDDLAIGVGARPTRANHRLSGVAAVRSFLQWIVDTRARRQARPFASLERQRASAAPLGARLVVASNRIPPRTAGGRQRPVGGLVAALEPAMHAYDGVWLGWSGNEADGERRLTIDSASRPVCASFDFPPAWRTHFYAGFCNRALWPLFHGFPSRVTYADEDWLAYVTANGEFARHARSLVASDGTIWIHDYHLLLAGRMLRHDGFTGPLGLFLHVPFPPPDLFETLPWAAELVSAMLDFDVVGFHTAQWADNFRRCAAALAPARALPGIEVLPVGVSAPPPDPAPPAVDRDVAGLRKALGARRMILGVDRLDYAKGIPERLLAFERLLEVAPAWRGQDAPISGRESECFLTPLLDERGEGILNVVFNIDDADEALARAQAASIQTINAVDYTQEEIDEHLDGLFTRYKEYFLNTGEQCGYAITLGQFEAKRE